MRSGSAISPRAAARLAWTIGSLCLVGTVAGLALTALNGTPDGTTGAYARYTLAVAPGSLPGGLVLAWVGALAFAPIVWVLLILLPLYFPTGRLLSPRWRLIAWAGGLFTALALVGNGLRPDIAEIAGIGTVRIPFAIPSAIHVLDLLLNLALPFLIVGIGGAVAAVVVRFRRAHGVERAQLKWFT
jgi:hypothetical protein